MGSQTLTLITLPEDLLKQIHFQTCDSVGLGLAFQVILILLVQRTTLRSTTLVFHNQGLGNTLNDSEWYVSLFRLL